MSMPSNSPLSVVISYGGNAALVDIVSLPALTVVTAAASAEAASSVETASEDAASLETVSVEAEPPQAARLSIIAELSIRAVSFFMMISSIHCISMFVPSQALTWLMYTV